jgi:hypothetical protein
MNIQRMMQLGILGGKAAAPVLPTIAGEFLDIDPSKGMFVSVGNPAINDGDLVGVATDQSGAGNNMTEATNKPTLKLHQLNGKPAISFNATTNVLTGTMPAGQAKTIFIVYKRNEVGVSANWRGLIKLANNHLFATGNSYGSGFTIYGGDQTQGQQKFRGAISEWNVITLKHITQDSFRMYINGILCGDTTYNPHNQYATSQVISIGYDGTGGGDGLYARLLGWDTALNDTNRAAVENYLLAYYGLSVATQRIEFDSIATVPSTVDAVTCAGYAAFPWNSLSLPILLIFGGWDSDMTIWTHALQKPYAARGIFCVFMSTRGRSGASGTRDAGGIEIHDVYDVLNAVKTRYADIVDPTQVYIYGYSGGGFVVHESLTKFPDTYNGGISLYGISDPGRDPINGWWAQNVGYRAGLQTYIGGTPAAVPNNYYARDAEAAYANYSAGHLWMFHDIADDTVPSNQSDRVKATLDAASLANYEYHLSQVGDTVRYLHTGEGEPVADNISLPSVVAKAYPDWTVPASGTLEINGEIVTKRFSIKLRANGSTIYRLDAAATVTYGITPNVYTITPLTGAIDVVVTQIDAKTGSATNISTATDITVS